VGEKVMMKEVLDLVFEFLISLLVIAGGGALMWYGRGESTFLTSMIALVIYFWFQSRTNNATVTNLLKQLPIAQQPPQIRETLDPSQEPQKADPKA
jgi:hypothetical protein